MKVRGAIAAVVILGWSMPVRAECRDPWLRLRTRGLASEFEAALLTQVRSSLAARAVDLCVLDEPGAARPLATVEVTSTDDVATILIDDGVTDKRVSRAVDLRAVPSDGRALTIALALDELLRASWAELLLVDAKPPAPPPPIVMKAVAASPPKPSVRSWELGAGVGVEHFGEGHTQLGPDLVATYAPWSRFGFDARLGFRQGLAVDAPRGEVRSTGFLAKAGAFVGLLPRAGRAGVDLLAEVLVENVLFVAEPSMADVRGREEAFAVVDALTGVRGWLSLASMRAYLRGAMGVPLHTAYALDGATRITGLAGLLVACDAGLGWVF